MKLILQLFTVLGVVVATSHALSCACFTPSPNLSNALYTKPYAIKVRVKKLIPRPTPAPVTMDPDLPPPPQLYMPDSWMPSYYTAKVKNIFKQPNGKGGEMLLEYEEEIVVQGGSCSPNPDEKTPYIIITHGLYEMDVPGHGKAKVLTMPGYCEFKSKWKDLSDDRIKQLRKYKKEKGDALLSDGLRLSSSRLCHAVYSVSRWWTRHWQSGLRIPQGKQHVRQGLDHGRLSGYGSTTHCN